MDQQQTNAPSPLSLSHRPSRKHPPRPDLLTASQAIEATGLPKSTFEHLVREGLIPKETLFGKKEGFYPLIFIETLSQHLQGHKTYQEVVALLQQLSQQLPQAMGTTDWLQLSDLPYVLALDYELYGLDRVIELAVLSSWWFANPSQCRILFDRTDRTKVWGYLTFMPLPLDVIFRLLRGELAERDINPGDILALQPTIAYDCYALLALRPQYRFHSETLIKDQFAFWCEQAPSIELHRVYTSANDEARVDFVKHLFFSPVYALGTTAFELDPVQPNPSQLIGNFQQCVAHKRHPMATQS
jgi:hypothetical protein